MERRAFCRTLLRLSAGTLFAGGFSLTATAAESPWLSAIIKRALVDSTNLRSIGYHRGLRVLEIEFQSGSVYRYREVPLNAYEAFLRAESKGRHFSRHIRGRYEFKRTDNLRP